MCYLHLVQVLSNFQAMVPESKDSLELERGRNPTNSPGWGTTQSQETGIGLGGCFTTWQSLISISFHIQHPKLQYLACTSSVHLWLLQSRAGTNQAQHELVKPINSEHQLSGIFWYNWISSIYKHRGCHVLFFKWKKPPRSNEDLKKTKAETQTSFNSLFCCMPHGLTQFVKIYHPMVVTVLCKTASSSQNQRM